MNDKLGGRIKFLRESRGFTQEQMATEMNCTRQKYSRLEKGLIDISYANIIQISEILEIGTEEITNVLSDESVSEPMFRAIGNQEHDEDIIFVNKMLDIFYAHGKLYNSVKKVNADE